ncbi:MAG TPA: DUF4181 domain-containing protein [Bacillus sp. (in: firmicutes)]|nr:DUF4181 domain-containing protein [Bacillus sp. (in: firmicutes)]
MYNFGLIGLIIALTYLALRIMIVGTKKVEISEDGKYIERWGRIILAALGVIIVIFINIEAIKWFFILFIIAIIGFQSFIDWKYRKGSKEYIASLITLIVGVLFVYFAF